MLFHCFYIFVESQSGTSGPSRKPLKCRVMHDKVIAHQIFAVQMLGWVVFTTAQEFPGMEIHVPGRGRGVSRISAPVGGMDDFLGETFSHPSDKHFFIIFGGLKPNSSCPKSFAQNLILEKQLGI